MIQLRDDCGTEPTAKTMHRQTAMNRKKPGQLNSNAFSLWQRNYAIYQILADSSTVPPL